MRFESNVLPLTPAQLYRRCAPESLGFATTADIADVPELLGQERAVEAIHFGVGIKRYGYNLFALGPSGMGKHGFVRRFLEEQAAKEPTPSDWCYVGNFADPSKPRALELPPGRGAALRGELERLVGELRDSITAAFESEDYRNRKKVLEAQFAEASERVFGEIDKRARERGVALIRTPVGVALAPVREGEVMDPDEFHRLSEEEQGKYRAEMSALQEEMQRAVGDVPRLARRHRDAVKKLDREVTEFAVGHLLEELRARWNDVPAVLTYLEALQQDVLEHADDFQAEPAGGGEGLAALLGKRVPERGRSTGYAANVLVDHGRKPGAPVVYEDHPSQGNLIGRIEHLAEFGNLVSDFRLIKPGALHRANGGYLILDARRVLQEPLAWDSLKRSLRLRQVRIESLGQALGLVHTASLEPEPIPLDVKIVLVGDRALYYALAALDPDFPELFKVAADFAEVVDRAPESEARYAGLLATIARREGLRPLDCAAVARVIEHGARLAADAGKLSVQAESLAELLQEADYLAGCGGREVVTPGDVQQAIDLRIRRADRLRERVHEQIRRGTVLIDTRGEKTGQVNGLSVVQLGDFAFGRPSRITARVRVGSGEIVDIEREVELGGPIHSKGVLILAGFLGARYSSERPLALQASLVFEQSYSGVEGDSASCAELVALLSALAEAPLGQSLAVTGSVDQHGQVQAVGAINEKIEGFFDVCSAVGLSGREGVLIPAANREHLMLRADVVDAVAEGRFRVYAIETVDQALELLTGLPAGERDAEGRFPEGTLNRRVEARLMAFAEKARAFGRAAKDEVVP